MISAAPLLSKYYNEEVVHEKKRTWKAESNFEMDASKSLYSKPATFWAAAISLFTLEPAPSIGLQHET